jgi:hypothetical protein
MHMPGYDEIDSDRLVERYAGNIKNLLYEIDELNFVSQRD